MLPSRRHSIVPQNSQKEGGGKRSYSLLICLEITNGEAAQDGWATVPFFAEISDTYVHLFAID